MLRVAVESILGVHLEGGNRLRIDVAHFSRAHDAIDFQITIGAGGRADADRFVGQLHMKRIHVRLRVNRERPDAEFLTGANDAERDFATICDQDFFEHQR